MDTNLFSWQCTYENFIYEWPLRKCLSQSKDSLSCIITFFVVSKSQSQIFPSPMHLKLILVKTILMILVLTSWIRAAQCSVWSSCRIIWYSTWLLAALTRKGHDTRLSSGKFFFVTLPLVVFLGFGPFFVQLILCLCIRLLNVIESRTWWIYLWSLCVIMN